jgi:hypothetical protein
MFRHVVLFRWTPEVTAEQRAAVTSALRALPGAIPSIRAYHVGDDAGVNDGNHDYAVVADFDDVAGYVAYRDHPAHGAVIVEHIAPILAERAAVQYELHD